MTGTVSSTVVSFFPAHLLHSVISASPTCEQRKTMYGNMLLAASKARKRKAFINARLTFPDSPGWLSTRKSASEVRACKAIANEAHRLMSSNNNGGRNGDLKEGAVLDQIAAADISCPLAVI